MRRFLFLILFITSCNRAEKKSLPFTYQEFNGREEIVSYGQMVRRPVYRGHVPLNWKRIDPSDSDSLLDTTKPIVAFALEDELILSVHTFPTDSLEERVPVMAQVDRWSGQIQDGNCHIEHLHHDGFAGLYFEGHNEKTTLCAWVLQLDFDLYQTLHFLASTVEEEEHYKQMSADYTIKVFGPSSLIEKHRQEILLFATSFGLIQEIPVKS